MPLDEAMLINTAVKITLDLLTKQIEAINNVQKHKNISDSDLISTEKRQSNELPNSIRSAFTEMRSLIRASIHTLAKDLENNKIYLSDLEEMDVSVLTQNHLDRMLNFAEATEDFAISHKTLSLVFKFVKACNHKLHAQAQVASRTKQSKNHLRSVAMSGILMHEILVIIIEHLEQFELHGVDRLLRIYGNAVEHMVEVEAREAMLERDYRQEFINDPEQIDRHLTPIKNRREVRHLAMKKLDDIINKIDVARNNTKNALSRLPRMKLLQRSAALHIETSVTVAFAEALNQDINALADLSTIDDLELVQFSISDVKSVLGID